MKNIYLTTILLGAISLSGCGGGGNGGDNSTPNSIQQSAIQKYKIVATPTSGGNCRGANGTMIIEGSAVSGTIKTGWGDNLIIGGTYSSANGDVSGGFAKSNQRLATYSGNIKNNSGSGKWSDSLGCSGTWTVTGLSSNSTNTSSSSTSTSTSTSTPHSSSKDMVNAHDIKGYQISYPADGLTTVVTFGCDGSFDMSTSNHGTHIPIDSGDSIEIHDSSNGKNGFIDLGIVKITLDSNNNVVVGESKAIDVLDDTYTISNLSKDKECN